MPFPKKVKEEVLLKSKRICCLCGRAKKQNIEVHHIRQESKQGSNTFDNAIAVCFDCHADIGHYNNSHPRGTKYTEGELKKRRDHLYAYLEKNPFHLGDHDISDSSFNSLNIFYEKDSRSNADVHYYWLNIEVANYSSEKQNSYVLELFFPGKIPINTNVPICSEKKWFGDFGYKKLILESDTVIHRGRKIQIVSKDKNSIRYEMNHGIFFSDFFKDGHNHKYIDEVFLKARFFLGNLDPIEKDKPWNDMHYF